MKELRERAEHPVATGLVALVAVAVVVGVIAGVAALAGAKVAGIGASDSTGSAEEGGASLFLPRPEPTQDASGPLITLAPGQESEGAEESEEAEESESAKPKKKPKKAISLQVGQTTVSPMQNIDLTGGYPGGEGAILAVQRFEAGGWADFYSVTANVSNGTFTTFVQTGQPGPHRFRVVDTDTGKPSNEVRVTVS